LELNQHRADPIGRCPEKQSPHIVRLLVRQLSRENPSWGAPRIPGELLMVGIEVAQSTWAGAIDRPRRTERRFAQPCRLHRVHRFVQVRSISFTHATLISSAW